MASLDSIHVVGEAIDSVRTSFRTEYSDRKLETYGLKRPLSEVDVAKMEASFANRDPRVDDLYRELTAHACWARVSDRFCHLRARPGTMIPSNPMRA